MRWPTHKQKARNRQETKRWLRKRSNRIPNKTKKGGRR